jgi:hypothetical protein
MDAPAQIFTYDFLYFDVQLSTASGKFCESNTLTKLPKPCAIDLPMPFDGSAAKRL